MNMKNLDVEQLSSVAGAEPRGFTDRETGHLSDGTDIVRSRLGTGARREQVVVDYDNTGEWAFGPYHPENP
jgi:hypothetical protein